MIFLNVKLCFAEKTSHLREVAYGKKSYQSSTFVENGTPYSSNLAVDGNMDTFMHTHSENYPHWEVDLGKNYQIKRVEIYTRRNCCGKKRSFINEFICFAKCDFLLKMSSWNVIWYDKNSGKFKSCEDSESSFSNKCGHWVVCTIA